MISWPFLTPFRKNFRSSEAVPMDYYFTIPGKFPSMNQFIGANRNSVHSGNNMKKKSQSDIIFAIMPAVGYHIRTPVFIQYTFYEENRKRDLDNVSGYFHKVFQDAIVQCRLLPNDTWNEIVGFSDRFFVDRKNPRIEVIIKEVDA